MAIFFILVIYIAFMFFDFLPQYHNRKIKKGIWLYALLMLSSFVVLIMTAAGVNLGLASFLFR